MRDDGNRPVPRIPRCGAYGNAAVPASRHARRSRVAPAPPDAGPLVRAGTSSGRGTTFRPDPGRKIAPRPACGPYGAVPSAPGPAIGAADLGSERQTIYTGRAEQRSAVESERTTRH
ncbi:hypothetical protein FTUN_8751 [Frigoriglobus tundricola]|uniref:Uncharacterized protein n=1 Tax=Frigoriglobus tundricola TaxID=2774151 RepID=A0A6M5Z6A0_9BACT|nr:hypothetical protein FTUN_8751 [Frigoriglobus tundricola]